MIINTIFLVSKLNVKKKVTDLFLIDFLISKTSIKV
jgi:hypothetical protein